MREIKSKMPLRRFGISPSCPSFFEEYEQEVLITAVADRRNVISSIAAWDHEGFEVGLSQAELRRAEEILLSKVGFSAKPKVGFSAEE